MDTRTWNAILALGHQNKKERGTFQYGAFFEYGSGNYSTFNGDERGDGSMHYTGGGLLAKYTVKRDKWNFYAGAAYEHELDGKATGTADGFAIRGADTGGASFRGEIGAAMTPGENPPWKLDLNVTGFAGKKQGVTGGVSVAFLF